MAHPNCENALCCYKDAHDEWWCDCYLMGDAQALGLQCGKGVCELYKPEKELKRRRSKGANHEGK